MTEGVVLRSRIPASDTPNGVRPGVDRPLPSVSGPEHLLIVICCAAAIAIGAVALAGYLTGNRSVAAVFPGFKPIAAGSAACFILLSVAVLMLPSRSRPSALAAAMISSLVALAAAADLLLLIVSVDLPEPRGGVLLNPYPTTAILIFCIACASLLASRGIELVAHVVSSAVLLVAATIFFGYIFEIPSFADPARAVVPVRGSTIAVGLLAIALLLARPRGWTAVVVSKTSTGLMLRALLPTVFIIPLVGGLLPLLHGRSWYTPTVGLTLAAAIDLLFTGALMLGAGAVLYKREIRERQLEEERAAAAGYARTLIEASLDPLVTISPEGKITDVNAATEKVTGRSRRDLIGTDFSDYFTDPEKARAGYRAVLAEGSVRDYALTLRHASGATTDVLYNATLYRDAAGTITGVFAAARDITELRRAEEERRAAAEYARSLLEASLDPLVTISHEGRITDVNAATEAVTGCSRRELIGRDFSDFFTEPERARAGYQKVLAAGEVRDYALTVRSASGATTDVLYNATVYRNAAGEIAGVFAAARDMTERKKAQESLAKTLSDLEQTLAELERSNRELEQFAYVASHDLQEPLRMVSSFTQLLAQRYTDRLDATANEFIGFAVDGANRMQRLITDLLKYSRVGTRGGALEKTDSRAALGYAIANLASAIEESGAMITSGDLPAVRADEGQLVQLFQNLLGNAIKFHRKDQAPHVRVSAVRDGAEWRFAVEDNGIGIAPELQPRLFVIFQRLHRRDEYPGTGIGLAICKRIVERHGGRIWMESEGGNGTTFFFTLPAAD